MVSLNPPVCDFGWKAVDFDLLAVDGKRYTLNNIKGPNGLLVMFICNHCPYVKAIVRRLAEDCAKMQKFGVNVIAISSNDVVNFPDDSFDNMKKFAQTNSFTFPYAYDETQEIARAYDAVCTPDFFGFNANLELQYRGRFDNQGRDPNPKADAVAELLNAMKLVAETGRGPAEQTASIGCSIKWFE